MAEEPGVEGLHPFHRRIKGQVHQAADDPDSARQQQVQGLLAEDELLPHPQSLLPVPVQVSPHCDSQPFPSFWPQTHKLVWVWSSSLDF